MVSFRKHPFMKCFDVKEINGVKTYTFNLLRFGNNAISHLQKRIARDNIDSVFEWVTGMKIYSDLNDNIQRHGLDNAIETFVEGCKSKDIKNIISSIGHNKRIFLNIVT